MLILTGHDLEFLARLTTCWRRYYLNEVARLLQEDGNRWNALPEALSPAHNPDLGTTAISGRRKPIDRADQISLLGIELLQRDGAGSSWIGRVEMWRGGFRLHISVSASFVWRCLSGSTVTPFPHPAHRTGRANLSHPALGQDFTPSPTARRVQAQLSVRARSARRGARVDKSRPYVA